MRPVHIMQHTLNNMHRGRTMRTTNTLTQWVESLPNNVALLRVRVGDGTKLHTVGTVAIEGRGYKGDDSEHEPQWVDIMSAADTVSDILQENGFGEDHRKARIHGHTVTGKQSKTKSLTATTGRAATASSSDRALEKMTDGLLQMAGEMRRSLAVLSDTLTHREGLLTDAINSTLSARVDALDADAHSKMMEWMMDSQTEDEGDQLKSQASKMLESVVGMMTGAQANKSPSADQVREWIKRPDFKEMMRDPDLQADFIQAFMDMDEPEEEGPEVVVEPAE